MGDSISSQDLNSIQQQEGQLQTLCMELIALNELHHELDVRLGAVVSLSRSTWILTASQEGNNSSLLNMLSWVNEIKDCEKAVEMLAVAKQQPLIYSGKCHSSKICQMLFLVVFQRPFNVLHPSVWLLCKTGVKRKYFFPGNFNSIISQFTKF